MKIFYKGSAAAIVVYDITKEDTFSQLDKEIQVISTSQATKTTSARVASSP